MAKQNQNYGIENAERDRLRQARKEKWAQREKNFWKAFLFTEDGRPKSGRMVYTFCLSFVLIGIYIVTFFCVIEGLKELTADWPVFLGNLIQSLAAGAVGVVVSWLLHIVLSDNRLVFGTYLWLTLYATASLVALMVMLRGTGAVPSLLTFFGWFVAVPLAMGLGTAYYLYRRDCVPPRERADEPAWKQYTKLW